jgi:hypothetical protein
MSSTKLTTDNIRSLDASKLSGALPSLDGSNLTHLGDVEVSDGDPLPTSNKSLGQIWMNHSSGESYMCTDATVGSNVWTNIGASGTGDIFKPPFSFQGTHGGYMCGGEYPHSGYGVKTHKFIFANSTQQNNLSDLIYIGGNNMTCTKDTSASWIYAKGGPGYMYLPPQMQRWSMTSGVSTQAVGNLTGGASIEPCEFSTSSHGYYVGGGNVGGTAEIGNTDTNRFAFASNVSRQSFGTLQTSFCQAAATQDGEDYGYCLGNVHIYGTSTAFHATANQKINLQSATTSAYITSATYHILRAAGTSSTTHGYSHGGHWYNGPAGGNITSAVNRFQFSTGSGATEVGSLSHSMHDGHGFSSTSYGFSAGGIGGSSPLGSAVYRYAYSSSVSSTSWGTLKDGGNTFGGSAEN